MVINRRVICLSIAIALASCAGVGVVDSRDPLTKLNDAEYLFENKNRPVPAETLILEATAIYEQRSDSHGLGNANREYGDFLKSAAVFNWREAYRRSGFFDRSVTYDNRLDKAAEHYTKALEYYGLAAKQEIAAENYSALTGTYWNMALSNAALGSRDEACVDYDRALQAYHDNMERNPTAHPHGSGVHTVPESIAAAKKAGDCKEAASSAS